MNTMQMENGIINIKFIKNNTKVYNDVSYPYLKCTFNSYIKK